MTIKLKGEYAGYVKRNPLRICVCFRCGWVLAARSTTELEDVGWMFQPDYKADGTMVFDQKAGFICRTCVKDAVAPERASHGDPETFRKFKRAAESAFPRVGGEGVKHAHTSRP